jgi:hypothetical protein
MNLARPFKGNNILDESGSRKDNEESGYSQVRHYATSVFPFSDRERWIAVMAEPLYYTAYMDETGHAADASQRFCGMAGFLAPSEKWEEFESKWKKVLREFHIPYFHMREFAHSKGAFADWKGKEHKRRKLFDSLLHKIAAIHPVPIGSITSLDAFRRLTKEDQALHHDPYIRSVLDCATWPGVVLQDRPLDVKFAMVFSQQTEFRHKAESAYQIVKRYGLFSGRMLYPDFKEMQDLVPLQAADIAAYELHREFERRLYNPKKQSRYGYLEIVKMAKRAIPGRNPFAFHDDYGVRRWVSHMKSGLSQAGVAETNHGEAWRWLYSQPLARAAGEKK